MPETLLSSPRYAEFVRQRDHALERIHANGQIDLARLTSSMLSQIENLASSAAIKAKSPMIRHQLAVQFETGTREIMAHAFPLFVRRIVLLRRAAFTLSYAGEQEAIGRATQRHAEISRDRFSERIKDEVSACSLLGPLDQQVWASLMRLRGEIITAFELAITQELSPAEIVEKIAAAFPRLKVYKRAPAALSRVREATGTSRDSGDWFDFDFIDDSDWDLAVNAYKDTVLPEDRFSKVPGYVEGTGMMKYAWELEQEVTDDFVRSVRSGQVAGANDLGVKDFVWIAIIDNHTCDECCLPRNGKTTAEIEALDDDCDATVPPAHPNCRCQIGPVASTDPVEGPDWSSFNEWLEPKAA